MSGYENDGNEGFEGYEEEADETRHLDVYEGVYEKEHENENESAQEHSESTSAVIGQSDWAIGQDLFEHNIASPLTQAWSQSSLRRTKLDAPDVYSFTVVNGKVVSVTETEDGGRAEVRAPSANEVYTISGQDIIKTEPHRNGQELTRFIQNIDGQYVKASKQWSAPSEAPADLSLPQITQPLTYSHTDADDLVAVSVTQSALGGVGADHFVFTELGHLIIDDFDRNEHDLLVFDTGLGLLSLEHLVQLVTAVSSLGDDLIFEFGQGVSIQIVGGVTQGVDAGDVLVLS